MEIDIVRKNDNTLLERTEVDFTVKHTKEKTPSRKDLSEALREALMLKKEILVVDSFGSEFGKGASKGKARIYKDLEQAKKVEDDYLLKRNNLAQEEKK